MKSAFIRVANEQMDLETRQIVKISSYGNVHFSTPKYGTITAVRMIMLDCSSPEIEYEILGSWYPREAIKAILICRSDETATKNNNKGGQ